MIKTYILMVIFFGSPGGAYFQEFTSLKQCQANAKYIKETALKVVFMPVMGDNTKNTIKYRGDAYCTEK